MKTYTIPQTDLTVSRLAYGSSMLAGWDRSSLNSETIDRVSRLINIAYDAGITLFDLADVYGFGKAESAFGEALKRSAGLRDRIVIQTKCAQKLQDHPNPGDAAGIDCSYDHIVASVEHSLARLHTDHLDILLLHSPDPLMEPDEVARAFDHLYLSGKVRFFGVSNYGPGQIELLKASVQQPLVINQLQLSLTHNHLLSDGVEFALEFTSKIPSILSGRGGQTLQCLSGHGRAWNAGLLPDEQDADSGLLAFAKHHAPGASR